LWLALEILLEDLGSQMTQLLLVHNRGVELIVEQGARAFKAVTWDAKAELVFGREVGASLVYRSILSAPALSVDKVLWLVAGAAISTWVSLLLLGWVLRTFAYHGQSWALFKLIL